MMTYIWIEGERNLNEFCEKRFRARPQWLETIGRVGVAKVRLIYKQKPDGHYTDCYLLYMNAPHATTPNAVPDGVLFDEIQRWTYEQIRADKTSIVKK